MRLLALLLLVAPVSAAPLALSLEHGPCTHDVATPEADAYLRLLAAEVEWIAARNAWRQRRADTRARTRAQAQRDPRSGAGPFGLPGVGYSAIDFADPDPADDTGSGVATATSDVGSESGWFEVLPVDPATPGYAYTGSGGQQVGWRQHPVYGDERFHTGLDLGVPEGTPIHAVGDATVVGSGFEKGFGNWLILEHAGGVRSFYAHMFGPAKVREGSVAAGQVVGYVGSTGTSTAAHLHFEVWAPRADLPEYAAAWVAEGAYPLDEGHMPGRGIVDPARLVDFSRRGGTPGGEGARATMVP